MNNWHYFRNTTIPNNHSNNENSNNDDNEDNNDNNEDNNEDNNNNDNDEWTLQHEQSKGIEANTLTQYLSYSPTFIHHISTEDILDELQHTHSNSWYPFPDQKTQQFHQLVCWNKYKIIIRTSTKRYISLGKAKWGKSTYFQSITRMSTTFSKFGE